MGRRHRMVVSFCGGFAIGLWKENGVVDMIFEIHDVDT